MRLNISKLLILGFFAALIVAVVLATLAIIKYPGSTPGTVGFNFVSDYWCDLFKLQTPTGLSNPGMIFAKLATITAAFSFVCFWIAVPIQLIDNKREKIIAQTLAVPALIIGSFLFTGYHDKVILIGSILGFFAMLLLLKSLKENEHHKPYYLGVLAISLLVFCNALVYAPGGFGILAVTQKISCVVMILWMFLIAKNA